MPQTIDNMSAIWSNSLTTYTFLKTNITGPSGGAEQSAAGSLLMDLQVGGSSKAKVAKDGSAVFGGVGISGLGGSGLNIWTPGGSRWQIASSSNVEFNNGGVVHAGFTTNGFFIGGTSYDVLLTRRAAANLRLGAADAAAPVAQTLSVQSVVAGTTNTAGANLTITGSQGTGTGAGGSIVFQVAPAGSSGTAQNALATALTINPSGTVSIGGLTIDPSNGGITFAQTFGITMQTSNAFTIRHGNGDGLDVRPVSSGSPNILLKNASSAIQAALWGEANNTLALRNGAAAQTFRVYNTTDGTNSEFGKIAWSSNVLQIGTEKGGTGTARALEFQTNGNTRLTLGATGDIFTQPSTGVYVHIRATASTSASLNCPADGVLLLTNWAATDFNRLQFGGTTSSFPALKRSTTVLQTRLADDSGFATIQGKLRADVNAVAETPTATHTITITDAAGTAYKVLCVAA